MRKIFCLAVFLLFFLFGGAYAETPLGLATTARSLSLGNAYVGMAADAGAVLINPAGIGLIDHYAITTLYSQIDVNANYASLVGVVPDFFGGTIGLAYKARTISGLQVSTEVADQVVSEATLSYGRQFREGLAFGGSIRLLGSSLSQGLSFTEASGSGFAYDLGLRHQGSSWFNWGLVLRGIGASLNYGSSSEVYPADLVLGTSFKLTGSQAYFKNDDKEKPSWLNLDLSKGAEDNLLFRLGLEYWQTADFALRIGLDQSSNGAQGNYTHLTSGLGLKFKDFSFDYALYKQGDENGALTHYFSLNYDWPKPAKALPTPEAVVEVTPEVFATPESITVVKKKRARFWDVPANFWAAEEIELLATAGLIAGFPDGSFRPKQKVSRGDFYENLSEVNRAPLSMVRDPDLLIRRSDAFALTGAGGKVARPKEYLTRAEMAILFYRTPAAQAAIKRLPELED